MTRIDPQSLETPGLTQRREDLAVLLLATCAAFIDTPKLRIFIGDDHTHLHRLLSQDPGNFVRFAAFSNSLRSVLVRSSGQPGFDSEPFWLVIDSIGFYYDSVPGRWPYNGAADLERNIRWSTEFAEAVSTWVH
ncbi:MAG: hypothetical protein E6R08_01105 [Nevskiaceae bacterium]|nr:MAG: hypothetical protein E6R08_01105 [Nevskiaceae bacterium]